MSKFLHNLVRSKSKSCEGKIKYPSEASAQRNALVMHNKKGGGEIFEYYECEFCEGWHVGHRTNFNWIPASHVAYTLLLNQYFCPAPCEKYFITNTLISNHILTRFPMSWLGPEINVRCPYCKNVDVAMQSARKLVPLMDIPDDSIETIDSLWERS